MMARVIGTLRNLVGALLNRTHDRHCPCGVPLDVDDDTTTDTVARKVIVPDARP